jgi:hypothetical protein
MLPSCSVEQYGCLSFLSRVSLTRSSPWECSYRHAVRLFVSLQDSGINVAHFFFDSLLFLYFQPTGIYNFTMMFNKLTLLAVFGMVSASEALMTNPLKTGQKAGVPS